MRVLKEKADNTALATIEVSCTGRGFSYERGCGRLLEATGLDIYRGSSNDYSGDSSTFYYVRCPMCHCRTEVFHSEIKNSMWGLIKIEPNAPN